MSSSRSPPSPRSRPAAASAAAPAEGAPAGVGEAAFAPLTGVAALATAAALYLCERHGPSDYSLGATTHGAAACLRLAAASFLACTTLLSLLPRGASLDCRARVVSTVHALVSCYLAAHALRELAGGRPLLALAGERLRGDAALALWRADAGWANAATSVIAGYTAADISFALLLDGSLLDGAMRVHHAIALFAFGSSVVAGFAVPYMALVVLTEASTPLLNFYHTWARHGVLRIANGFLLWLAYVLFRVVLMCVGGGGAEDENAAAF